jgi:hypothetical protein
MSDDSKVLARSAEQARGQLVVLRSQLSAVSEEIAAIDEFLRRIKDADTALPPVDDAAFEPSASKAQLELATVLESVGGSDGDDEATRRRRLAAVSAVDGALRRAVGESGELEELGVAKSLHALLLNTARPTAAAPRGGGRVPQTQLVDAKAEQQQQQQQQLVASSRGTVRNSLHRVWVFSGPSASLSFKFNCDDATTFAGARRAACHMWDLEEEDYALQSNHSADSDEFVPFEYDHDDLLTERLLALKADGSRGMGCNGLASCAFATAPELLPPLYLVLRASARQGGAGEAAGEQGGDESELFARVPKLRRLFIAARERASALAGADGAGAGADAGALSGGGKGDPNDYGLLSFDEFCGVVHAYFEGHFFDRATLLTLFVDKAEVRAPGPAGTGAEQYHRHAQPGARAPLEPELSFTSCVQLVAMLNELRLGKAASKAGSGSFGASVTAATAAAAAAAAAAVGAAGARHAAHDEAARGAHVEAFRVFEWMAGQGTGGGVRRGRNGRSRSAGQVSFDDFEVAISLAVPANSAVVERWWQTIFGVTLEDALFADRFAAGWPELARQPAAGGANAEAEAGELLVGEAVERAVVRFEQKRAGRKRSGDWQLLQCELPAAALVLVALVLAWLAALAQNDSITLGRVHQMLVKSMVKSPFNSYEILDVIPSTDLFPPNATRAPLASDFLTCQELSGCVAALVTGPVMRTFFSAAPQIGLAQAQAPAGDAPSEEWRMLSYSYTYPAFVSVRQLRVISQPCSPFMTKLTDANFTCQGAYTPLTADQAPLTPANVTPLYGNRSTDYYNSSMVWQDFGSDTGLDPVVGRFATYDPSGYIFLFAAPPLTSGTPLTSAVTAAVQGEWQVDALNLIKLRWMGWGTRAVFVNVMLFNYWTQLYTNLEFLVECSASGEVHRSYQVRSFRANVAPTSQMAVANSYRVAIALLLAASLLFEFLALRREPAMPRRDMLDLAGGAGVQGGGAPGAEAEAEQGPAEVREQVQVQVQEGLSRQLSAPRLQHDGAAVGGAAQARGSQLKRRAVWCARSLLRASVLLTLFCLAWEIAAIVLFQQFTSNPTRRNLFSVAPPTSLWNGVQLWEQFERLGLLDSVQVVLVSCKLVSWMRGLPVLRSWRMPLVAARPALLVLFAVQVAAVAAFSLAFASMGTFNPAANDAASSTSPVLITFALLLGSVSMHGGLQEFTLNQEYARVSAALWLLYTWFNLFVVVVPLALVVALLFYVKSPRFRSSGGAEEQGLMQAPGPGPRRFEAKESAASRHVFELRRSTTAHTAGGEQEPR